MTRIMIHDADYDDRERKISKIMMPIMIIERRKLTRIIDHTRWMDDKEKKYPCMHHLHTLCVVHGLSTKGTKNKHNILVWEKIFKVLTKLL